MRCIRYLPLEVVFLILTRNQTNAHLHADAVMKSDPEIDTWTAIEKHCLLDHPSDTSHAASPLKREGIVELYYSVSRYLWSQERGPFFGLQSVSDFERRMLDMGPFVALIGMRLHEHWGDNLPLLVPLRVLLVMLNLPIRFRDPGRHLFAFRSGGDCMHRQVTVGQVLQQCYGPGALKEPDAGDLPAYRKHVERVRRALRLVSLWEFDEDWLDEAEEGGILFRKHSIDELLSMRLSKFWEYPGFTEIDWGLPRSEAASFRTREMSLGMLRKIGKLNIDWTEFIDDHLQLSRESSTLKLFWFGFSANAIPIFQ